MISIVVPVLNEEESLKQLLDEIRTSTSNAGVSYEVIFVDDGSSDQTWPIIAELTEQNPGIVQGIRFRRNFGKAAALSAGFRIAKGEFVLTMDGDLQDDPAELPRFLEALEKGTPNKKGELSGRLDVVSGWKKKRHDPWHKVFPSRVFNWLVSSMTGVKLHDHNCGMKCYRVEAVKEVQLYGEMHRFIPVLTAARGYRVGEIEINHRQRQFGKSKYGIRRFMRGFLDLLTVRFLTGYGQRPQHMLGGFGLLFFLIGGAILTYLAGIWVWNQIEPDPAFTDLHRRPLVIYAMGSLLLGAQMMSIGLLAELITSHHARGEDHYSIAESVPRPDPSETTSPE